MSPNLRKIKGTTVTIYLIVGPFPPCAMNYRRLVSRFFDSWWTWIVILPFALLELLATIAAAYTGEWNLPALLALIIVLFVFRAVLIVFLFFTPVPVGIIAAWACIWLFKKRSKKENRQAQHDQRTNQNA
jgi:hypothetical protein